MQKVNEFTVGSYSVYRAQDLELATDACHLWRITYSSDYVGKLNKAEFFRYQRMTHEEARLDFSASRAGLREVLGCYLNCPSGEVSLGRGKRGKPYLPSGPEFNLSHTAGLVLLAVSAQPVGLDVEFAGRKVRFAKLAAKFFSLAEQRRIAAAPPTARNGLFLRHWVCKEAVVKLSGDGIFRGLRDVEIFLERDGGPMGRFRGREVWLREFCPADGFLAALASWQPLQFQGRFQLSSPPASAPS
jgi:4'-phosphopantetheinyl transferase